MPGFIAETPRLILREMTPDDAENAYLLNLDPEVIKYTGDDPFESIGAARTFLENYNHYKLHGYGRWAVIRKADGEFLGWCGLKHHDGGVIDLGYRLMKKYWNCGYSTEASRECLKLGFERFKMAEITAHAMKENTASIRVMEKLGMEFVGEMDFDAHIGVVYKVARGNFLK